jgi:four helix bundle protein
MPNAECRMPNAETADRLIRHRLWTGAWCLLETKHVAPYNIRQRAFEFACAIVKFYFYLVQETKTPRRIAEQLLDSGTAPSAILEEAEAAHSRPDFVAKISTALKEAREAHQWLRIIRACSLAPSDRVEPHLKESDEIIRILTAIRKNAGHRSDSS